MKSESYNTLQKKSMMSWGSRVTNQLEWRKGPWTPYEDKLLCEYVRLYGDGRWSSVAQFAGLNRSGKSCRLRWVNYLRPGLKRCQITPQEEAIIIELHALWGNKWSSIARCLPGRTDNEIKNYWRTNFKKRSQKSSQQEGNRVVDHSRQKQQSHGRVEYLVSQANTGVQGRKDNEDQKVMMACPTMDQDQWLPLLTQDNVVGSWSDNHVVEEELWGGMWSLDDQKHGCVINHAINNNCRTDFSIGGDPNTTSSNGG